MPLVIHVWPGRWDLPSFDPACLAAILYLQMAFRGQFSVVEEANPDLSPSGQLPYLTHLSHSISPLASIIAYLGALDPETFAQLSNSQSFELIPSLDAALSSTQRNQTVVWRAYIEFHVGDLVNHSFYSFHPNFTDFTRPLLASMLPWPQGFYVPDRCREMLRPRLENLMMWYEEDKSWPVQSIAPSSSPIAPNGQFRRMFDKAWVLDKARNTFGLISGLLEERAFFHGARPSTLDVILASYVLPVLNAPLPDAFLRDLLVEFYPRVVTHARLVWLRAFPSVPTARHQTHGIVSAGGMKFFNAPTSISGAAAHQSKTETEAERRFRVGRWAWSAFAIVGLLGYALSQGVLVIERVDTGQDGGTRDEL